MKILLDSVILIDHFNSSPRATAYLNIVQPQAAISVVTRAEVLVGIEDQQRRYAIRTLELFPLLDVSKEIADLSAQLRRQFRWRLPDAFQAAIAQHHRLQLATRNTRDFDPAKHSFVVVPY